MEPYYPTIARPIDARFASWLSSSPPSTVEYHLRCGMSFPVQAEGRHGMGPGWEARAVAAVVRECYRLGLVSPALEEVEVVTLSVLLEPPEEDRRPGPPLAPGPRERWERAVRVLSEAAHRIVRHGPASGSAGGEVIHAGGVLRTEAAGLPLEARVDLIWRRPDGALEAVLVVEEPWEDGGAPGPAEDDWRCVLAAVVVSRLYGESPDLHTVWTPKGRRASTPWRPKPSRRSSAASATPSLPRGASRGSGPAKSRSSTASARGRPGKPSGTRAGAGGAGGAVAVLRNGIEEGRGRGRLRRGRVPTVTRRGISDGHTRTRRRGGRAPPELPGGAVGREGARRVRPRRAREVASRLWSGRFPKHKRRFSPAEAMSSGPECSKERISGARRKFRPPPPV